MNIWKIVGALLGLAGLIVGNLNDAHIEKQMQGRVDELVKERLNELVDERLEEYFPGD